MIEPRLFLCSGAKLRGREGAGRKLVPLTAFGTDANVTIRITDVARIFMGTVPSRVRDVLEIASYVFTADAGTRRGSAWEDNATESWSRDFRFVIAVRDVAFWQQPDTVESLRRILMFLSNDQYSFRFVPLRHEQADQEFLQLGDQAWPFIAVDDIIMFSGGLDSLAGAVETAAMSGAPMVLVSHRPVGQISARQQRLFAELQGSFVGTPMLHVPIWINKANQHGHEPTQRTRSFLFACIGMCVGAMTQAKRILFFENGVVSLNLPVADEVVRARASRTTHPHSLRLLTDFAGRVMGRHMEVVNPYINETKSDVVSTIVRHGAGHLIGLSVSCAHTMFMPKNSQHCGTCSQCIDRRIAIMASGNESLDSSVDYVSDVLTGPRQAGPEQTMAIHFARHSTELRAMSSAQFVSRFNLDLTRAVRGLPDASKAMGALYDLHQRHGSAVHSVLSEQLQANAHLIAEGRLEPTSMLALIANRKHRTVMWASYSDRVGDLLAQGVPAMCRTHQPKDEPHLQELAEGILKSFDPELEREFPFMRWSSSATKPDFSKEPLSLWIELKYVRKKADVRVITEDIAADITKYGDGGMRVLFVVYDPKHVIPNDTIFAGPIVARSSLRVRFVR